MQNTRQRYGVPVEEAGACENWRVPLGSAAVQESKELGRYGCYVVDGPEEIVAPSCTWEGDGECSPVERPHVDLQSIAPGPAAEGVAPERPNKEVPLPCPAGHRKGGRGSGACYQRAEDSTTMSSPAQQKVLHSSALQAYAHGSESDSNSTTEVCQRHPQRGGASCGGEDATHHLARGWAVHCLARFSNRQKPNCARS